MFVFVLLDGDWPNSFKLMNFVDRISCVIVYLASNYGWINIRFKSSFMTNIGKLRDLILAFV